MNTPPASSLVEEAKMDRLDEAVRDTTAAIELGHSNPDVLANIYHNRADVYVKLGRLDLAKKDLGRAVAIATAPTADRAPRNTSTRSTRMRKYSTSPTPALIESDNSTVLGCDGLSSAVHLPLAGVSVEEGERSTVDSTPTTADELDVPAHDRRTALGRRHWAAPHSQCEYRVAGRCERSVGEGSVDASLVIATILVRSSPVSTPRLPR